MNPFFLPAGVYSAGIVPVGTPGAPIPVSGQRIGHSAYLEAVAARPGGLSTIVTLAGLAFVFIWLVRKA
jgi:hypothetical protein